MINKIMKVKDRSMFFNGKTYRCAIGKNGFSKNKQEGDNRTPLGVFPLCELWYRADKISAPTTHLPLKIITQNDGWCDDVNSPDYNNHVKLPFEFSHEKLWREDDVYDLIIPLGYNDSPIVRGKGSAIFVHIAKPDYSGTEGCVALAKEDLLEILPYLSTKTCIEIRE
ncbi:MAG: L,D-transpeptidase family protein [Rickettsiales bacterium]